MPQGTLPAPRADGVGAIIPYAPLRLALADPKWLLIGSLLWRKGWHGVCYPTTFMLKGLSDAVGTHAALP